MKGKIKLIIFFYFAMVAKDIKSTKDEPQIFNKAWNYPNLESQRKWQATIWKGLVK